MQKWVWVTMIITACSGSTSSTASQEGKLTTKPIMLTTKAEAGVMVEETDTDQDGKTDIWTFYQEVIEKDKSTKKLLRKSIDLNGDGKVDITKFYDEKGQVIKEEVDQDFDSKVDRVTHYKNEKIQWEEISSQFDGIFDVRKYYEEGALVLKQVSTRRNGVFDEYQYFVGNRLSRVGWDVDGDGKPDRFEDNPEVK